MENTENIRNFFGVQLRRAISPLTRLLTHLKVDPNLVTVLGTFLNVGAAVLVGLDLLVWAGVVFLVAGLFDMLDGALARYSGRASAFGAYLDSTLDRVSEGVVMAAIAYWFAMQGRSVEVALTVVALLGSLLVSYTRARAEGLGLECKVGLASRPERVVLIAVGLFFNVLSYVIYVMVALTLFTVGQRVVYTYRALRARERAGSQRDTGGDR
jgi:CDP-diacylglycerol--glycerol-3-phosphate 3-phosphatidyltransferase